MPSTGTIVKTRLDLDLKTPKKFKAIIHNDDATPFELVFLMLIRVFNKSKDEATQLTGATHEYGKSVVLVASYNYVNERVKEGTEFMIKYGCPTFKITIEEE